MIDRIKALFTQTPLKRVHVRASHEEWRADYRERRERVESLERALKPPRRTHSPNPIIDRLIMPRRPRPDDETKGGR